MAKLQAEGRSGLRIMEASISEADYSKLTTMDLRGLSDEVQNGWLNRHSLLPPTEGVPHGFEHVIRGTGMGDEYYFSEGIFHLLGLR